MNTIEDFVKECALQMVLLQSAIEISAEECPHEALPGLEIIPTFTNDLLLQLIKDIDKSDEEEIQILRDNYYIRICLDNWENKCIDRLSFYSILKERIELSMVLVPILKSPLPIILVNWQEENKKNYIVLMLEFIENEDIAGILITKLPKKGTFEDFIKSKIKENQ